MSDNKPEAVWVFPEEKKRMSGGRIAVIVAIVVVVLLIAAGLVFFLVPRGGAPVATPSPSASSATPSVSPTPSPSGSATPGPGVPTAPVTSPPPVPDPSVDVFRGQVQPRLDDATTGLTLVEGKSGPDAVQIVESLQNDAQNLATQPAPESIRTQWSDAINTYATKLSALRGAVSSGDAGGPLADARSALGAVRSLVGL
ncbi:hypothetical protein [uncultured Microbacterium sp.]|uniref:hypothetical protein n=1 Tax=uncultured Microbacterium sp. TaxID=191216 RepID=UPI0025E7661B|nr:hypothetical protein [uncultured Microbacterium sp.]